MEIFNEWMVEGREKKGREKERKEGEGKGRKVELLVCSGFHMVDLCQTKIIDCLQPESRNTW